jgi:putative sporulation protein YtaF
MMHGLLYTVLIALTNSVDSLGAWLAFSLKGIKITWKLNVWIAAMTFAVSAAATWAGALLLGELDARVCAWLSMAVFVSMGAWFMLEPLVRRGEHKRRAGEGNVLLAILEHPEEADLNRSKDIDFKEATLLGAALSINNAGGSFSAGMLGLDPWLIGLFSAVLSFGALWVGRGLSALLMKSRIGRRAGFISGAILILIGIKQLF